MATKNQQHVWTSPAAVRNQRTEAEYARARQALTRQKARELHEVDERFRILKNAYQMERMTIKEDYALRLLNLKTQIEHLRDKRSQLRHALNIGAETEGMGNLSDITVEINNIELERLRIPRSEHMALSEAEAKFNERARLTAEDRMAICDRYNKAMEELHEKYIKAVDDNRAAARQDQEKQEGGAQ